MGEMGNIFQNKKFLMPGDARINDKCPTLINSRHDYTLIILKIPYAWIRTALAVEPIPYKKCAGLLPEQ